MTEAKVVPGMARKVEDIQAIYAMAVQKVNSKGRMTEQGKEYTAYLNEIFDAVGIDQLEFQVAVEYIKVASDYTGDDKKLKTSLRSFLKNKGIPFKAFQAGGKGTPLIIERVN